MSRSEIFSKIKATTDRLPDKSPYPVYDSSVVLSHPKLVGDGLCDIFARNFSAVNGRPMYSTEDVAAFLTTRNQIRGYCDPSLWGSVGAPLQAAGLTVETEYERERYDEFQFGITLASGAIAESGSVILDDYRTSRRLAALSPWVHIAVVKKDEIYRSIPEAIAAFGDCPNIIWVTGPSKTADVEGILIEGVHGPGEQIALLL